MKQALLAMLTVFVLALGTPVKAESFEDGLKAYDEGDYVTAFEIWLPLAEQGSAKAQTMIGAMYAGGLGAQKNYSKAVRWSRMAAEQGVPRAQFTLGMMYQQGHGVPQDYGEAARLYRMAAEQGDASAQYNLGVFYMEGIFFKQNYTEANRWLRMAAEQGLGVAQIYIGMNYAKGRGVPQDFVTAHMWANIGRANSSGITEGQELLKFLHEIFTPTQLEEAQARARKCFNSNYQDCD